MGQDRSATFGKDDIPKFGDPPYDGEDDAFPNQDTEHISGNLPTVPTRVEELVSFVRRAVKSGYKRPGGMDGETDGKSSGLREICKPVRCINRW